MTDEILKITQQDIKLTMHEVKGAKRGISDQNDEKLSDKLAAAIKETYVAQNTAGGETGYMPNVMTLLRISGKTAMQDCFGIKQGEKVLIVSDETTVNIGRALYMEAIAAGADATLMEVSCKGKKHGQEPSPEVARALLQCDVFILPTSWSLSHTDARKKATERGARGATMPTITEDMMIRAVGADYKEVAKRSDRIANVLKAADKIRVTTPAGTDITFSIKGRSLLIDKGQFTKPGSFGNLPSGEVCAAPVEGTANGVIVIDGSILDEKVDGPITVKVKNGRAVEITGGRTAKKLNGVIEDVIKSYGENQRESARINAGNIAEFGIGTNDQAVLSGNILEDEKILGTVHIALGDSAHIGGNTEIDMHEDGILLKPTVTAEIDGKPVVIMQNGELKI